MRSMIGGCVRLIERLADWICERIGLAICFDGDLMAPDGSEAWWINASDDAPGDGCGGVRR